MIKDYPIYISAKYFGYTHCNIIFKFSDAKQHYYNNTEQEFQFEGVGTLDHQLRSYDAGLVEKYTSNVLKKHGSGQYGYLENDKYYNITHLKSYHRTLSNAINDQLNGIGFHSPTNCHVYNIRPPLCSTYYSLEFKFDTLFKELIMSPMNTECEHNDDSEEGEYEMDIVYEYSDESVEEEGEYEMDSVYEYRIIRRMIITKFVFTHNDGDERCQLTVIHDGHPIVTYGGFLEQFQKMHQSIIDLYRNNGQSLKFDYDITGPP